MKKKIYLLIMIITFVFGIKNISALDTSLKIYDYAQILSSNEEEKLKNNIDNFIELYNLDMVLVTVKHHEKSTTEEYAQDFYDYNNFGLGDTRDGIIFVIDFTFGYRDIYITTTGEAIRLYDDKAINIMLDDITRVSEEDYYTWFDTFISDATNFASMGVPQSNSNTYIDENGDYRYSSEKSINWLLITIISLIVPSIIIAILLSKHKMIRLATNANYYIKQGSINITNRSDSFLTTHTTSVRINDESTGSRGGSSISRGSSGISHGGGGRRL